MADVIEEVFDIRAKWKFLGLQLGIDDGTLNAINQECRENPDLCLYEVLSKWFRNGDATCENLEMALRKVSVGETRLANLIKKKYCHQKEPMKDCQPQDFVWKDESASIGRGTYFIYTNVTVIWLCIIL